MSDDKGSGGELASPGEGAAPERPRIEWAATDAVAYGIAAIKKDPQIILVTGVALVLMQVVGVVNFLLQMGMSSSPDDTVRLIGGLLNVALSLVSLAVSAYVAMGLTRYVLKLVRGQPAAMSDLFGPGPYLQMLIAVIVGTIITLLGCCLVCAPGVIVWLGIMFYAYPLIDRGMDGIAALKESWRITTGHKPQLFVYMLLAFLLSFGGLLLCGVGVFLAFPIISIGLGWIYMRLTGEDVVDMAA